MVVRSFSKFSENWNVQGAEGRDVFLKKEIAYHTLFYSYGFV